MEAFSWILALALGGFFGGLVTLTAILFALWDIKAELRKLNSKRRE